MRRSRRGPSVLQGYGFLRCLRLLRDDVPSFDQYPFSIPTVRHLKELEFDPKVTFFVGENGSGKSTLLEAIAISVGFNAEGGSKNFKFSTRSSESDLSKYLRVARGIRREKDGFFLRAEALFNAATYMENIGVRYGSKSLHEQSHGESFLALANHRFGGNGLYLLDEPEAALSPSRQLSLLKIINRLVERTGSQFLIATHSPILLAYPGALIYEFGSEGVRKVAYEDTEHYQITKDFLSARERYFKNLFAEDEPDVVETNDDPEGADEGDP